MRIRKELARHSGVICQPSRGGREREERGKARTRAAGEKISGVLGCNLIHAAGGWARRPDGQAGQRANPYSRPSDRKILTYKTA